MTIERYPCKHCGLSHSKSFVPMKCIEAASAEVKAMVSPQCPHGHTYGTCLMCYHDLVGEQQGEIEHLRAALTRYGKHDSPGMSDQPGCQKVRMGGGPCTCGLEEAMR